MKRPHDYLLTMSQARTQASQPFASPHLSASGSGPSRITQAGCRCSSSYRAKECPPGGSACTCTRTPSTSEDLTHACKSDPQLSRASAFRTKPVYERSVVLTGPSRPLFGSPQPQCVEGYSFPLQTGASCPVRKLTSCPRVQLDISNCPHGTDEEWLCRIAWATWNGVTIIQNVLDFLNYIGFQIPSQRSKYWAMGNDVTSETLGPGHPSLISFFGPYNDARFHFIRSKYLKVIQKMYSGGVRISCHHPDLPDCDGSVVGLTEGDDIYICGDFTNPVKYSQEWTRTKLVMHELFHLSGLGHLTEDPDCCVNGDCACGTHEARQKLIAEGNFDILLAEQWTYDIFNRYFLRSMMELSVCYPGIRSSPGVFSI